MRDLRLGAREIERAAGVTGAQLFVMHQLGGDRALSVNDLADRTKTDQSSVSVIVKRLVDAGLVARKASKEDARRVELRLTPAGRRVVSRAPEPSQKRLLGALGRLSPRELQSLTKALESVVHHMGIDERPPGMFFDEPVTSMRKRPRRKT